MANGFKVVGLDKLDRKLAQTSRDLDGQKMRDGMMAAATIISDSAQRNAPRDSGALRASLEPSVAVSGHTVSGVVGSDLEYALMQEEGTGIYAGNSPYFPSPRGLEQWARRHGLNPYAVAVRIYQRGGIPGKHYMQRAFNEGHERVVSKIESTVTEIVNR